MNININILNKILLIANCIQQCIKNITQYDQLGITPEMQGFFNIYKSISVVHHNNYLKNKDHMININRCRKNFWQNSTPIYEKNYSEYGHRETMTQCNKSYIYDKPTVNIILNGEKLKGFPHKLGTRQQCPLLSLFFNTLWNF